MFCKRLNRKCQFLLFLLFSVSLTSDIKASYKFDTSLIRHWKLTADCNDYSGNGNHGQNHGVIFLKTTAPSGKEDTVAVFNGTSYIKIADNKQLDLGKGDFSISVWIRCEDQVTDVIGDVLNKYDETLRKGFNFHITASASDYSSISDVRNVHFGIDNAIEGSWQDCGRPWPSNTLVSTLVVYKGRLYAGIADAIDPKDACRVFRYAGGKKWIDCGRLGDDLLTLSVQSTIVHKGNLYAGTGTWDWTKVQAGIGGPTHVYKYQGGTSWDDCGQVGEVGDGYRVESLASFKGHLYATTDRSSCYRYEGGKTWTPCNDEKIRFACMMVYRGDLYGAFSSPVRRYNGENIWTVIGDSYRPRFDITQIHTLGVYGGYLYLGSWPEGRVLRYDGNKIWTDCGYCGISMDSRKINEINDLLVYNGKLYAGVIPKAQLWRYEGDKKWTLIKQLVVKPESAYTTGSTWNRIPCMAIFQGRLYAGTSTCRGVADENDTTDAGKVFSWEAGKCVSYDDDLGSGWRHLVAVRQKGFLKLYVDSKLVSTSSRFDPSDYDISNNKPLLIGFGAENYFNGSMTDVRIYNCCLTADEINLLYNDFK